MIPLTQYAVFFIAAFAMVPATAVILAIGCARGAKAEGFAKKSTH
jgi:hypothetical protein